MDISMRSMLTAGVTAMTAAAIVVAPSVTPLPAAQVAVARPFQLSAAAHTLSPVVASAVTAATPPAPPPLNTPAEIVDAVWNAYVYWSQLGVYGASWLLSFVPYGNFVSDQLYAFYNPTLYAVDSLVTDLIEPVLADPTNPVVWSNGLTAVAYYGANSLLNLGINEVNLAINYFVNWLPAIPLFYVGNLAAPAAATTLVAAAVTPQQPTSVPELVRSALAPVENLVNTAVATLQKNIADTEATIKAAVLSKGVLATDPATDTLTTEDVVGSTTEPAAAATKAARPRFPAAVKDSVGSAKAGPQTASVGTAKATPGATKAGNEPRKSGHAAHAGNSAK